MDTVLFFTSTYGIVLIQTVSDLDPFGDSLLLLITMSGFLHG
ncbi:MAG TPA: hypothetical protein ACN46R_09845 [Prochlorococcus sp.]